MPNSIVHRATATDIDFWLSRGLRLPVQRLVIRGILWTTRTNADDRNALFGSVGFHF
jgi:hypothetical protein